MFRAFFSIAVLLAPGIHGQESPSNLEKSPIALLPNGSVLKGVLLPRYDSQMNLAGDLKIGTMTLIDSERVQGEDVTIRFYNLDRSLRGKVELKNATFDQTSSQLHANEPVEVATDRLIAQGSGLAYGFKNGEGYLRGPATTWIKAAPKTSMNFRPSPAPAIAALFATGLLPAAVPPYISEAEQATLKADSAPLAPEIREAHQATSEHLAAEIKAAAKAAEAAHRFIDTSDLKPIADPTPGEAPSTAPLVVKPNPDDTVITCQGGMYFDAQAGVLVYLQDVKVTDPRFTLTGANELKVFFDKPGKDEKTKSASDVGANFGDVQRLVATGAVRILQKGVDGKEPVEASGAILTYHVPKGEIIISDGFPWVRQGKFFARAKQAGLTLRLLTDGSFSTRGNWEMGGNLNFKK